MCHVDRYVMRSSPKRASGVAAELPSVAELVPRAHLDALAVLGVLLLDGDGPDDEIGELDVRDEGHAVVHRGSADVVAVGHGEGVRLGVPDVDDEVHLALVDEVLDVGLERGRGLVHEDGFHAARGEELLGALGRVDDEARLEEVAGGLNKVELSRQGPDAEEDGALGKLEARGAHGGDNRLVAVLAKGGHLARGRHLHAEDGVGSDEAREGEHGRLDAYVVDLQEVDGRGLHRLTHHHLSGQLNEVSLERLGDEREGARGAEVALDHLDAVVLGEELDVEGPRDV
mmetsp:Transcript_10100/g.29756  ORF Transcript_10100/g.29756 Transcript_10100/m.29756 type:complete len:286 (+) Transcript_10100:75-932(+)